MSPSDEDGDANVIRGLVGNRMVARNAGKARLEQSKASLFILLLTHDEPTEFDNLIECMVAEHMSWQRRQKEKSDERTAAIEAAGRRAEGDQR